MCSFRLAGAVRGGVPRKRGPPPVTDGLARERRRDRPGRRLDAPRMYCVAVINPMSCPRGLVALTYPLVNELCPRPHFSRKRCSFRIANALNVSSTDWQNVHRVIARPGVRGRGAGSGSGCLRGVRCGANGSSFFRLIDDARVFARCHSCQLPQPNLPRGPFFWATPANPGRIDRYSLRSKLCLSAFESQSFRRSPGRSIGVAAFGENKPPFWSPHARQAAGQSVLPRGSCTTFVVSGQARALPRTHKHPTPSTVAATRVVVFHSLSSFTFLTSTCPSPCPPASRSPASPPSTPWAR